MAFLIDQLNNSGLFAQSAYSASIATYDSNGNEITATYLTGVDLTPYQTTAGMTGYATTGALYNTSSTLSSAIDYVSANAGFTYEGIAPIVVNNTTQQISADTWTFSAGSNVSFVDDNVNKITRIDVTAQGGDVPSGIMVESACEYNAVNEISGYNGSAIAQYGAEKQWLVHDDTLVHASNSAQYALGCNISALQRLMCIDETVLWEGSANTTATTGTLSESLENFNMAKIYTVGSSPDRASIITTVEPRFGSSNYTLMYFPNYSIAGGTTIENTIYLQVFSDKTFKFLAGSKWVNGTYTQSITAYDFAMTKIVGIGRKS